MNGSRNCRKIPDITHLWVNKNSFPWLPDIGWLAALLFKRLAGGDSGVAVWRLPACGRVPHGSPADAPPARPSA